MVKSALGIPFQWNDGKAWCEMNHTQLSRFYYHIRRLRKNAYEIPANSKADSFEHYEIVKRQLDDSAVPAHDHWHSFTLQLSKTRLFYIRLEK